MHNLLNQLDSIDPKVVGFLDNLKFEVSPSMAEVQRARLLNILMRNSLFADIRRSEPPRDFESILTVVAPQNIALRHLAKHPGLRPRYGEVAFDLITADSSCADILHDIVDKHFVEPWHGRQETVHYADTGTTYTRRRKPGHQFTFYSDRPSKITGDRFCLHVEARYVGAVALRQIGIRNPADWFGFNHVRFWEKHFRLFTVDLTRLGRWHDNRQTGSRRKHVRLWRRNGFEYNVDRALGCVLFRRYGRHSNEEMFSVQRFVDQYGRGPFLQELDVSKLRPKPDDIILTCASIDHVVSNTQSNPNSNRHSEISNAVSA